MSNQQRKTKMKERQAQSPIIECACGCGNLISQMGANGKPRQYIRGHSGRKYISSQEKQEKQKAYRQHHSQNISLTKRKHYKLKQQKIVEKLGGICVHCGIKHDGINTRIFDCHHIDPSTKSFAIADSMHRKSLDILFEELKKCVLLCANCHRLVEAGVISLLISESI